MRVMKAVCLLHYVYCIIIFSFICLFPDRLFFGSPHNRHYSVVVGLPLVGLPPVGLVCMLLRMAVL